MIEKTEKPKTAENIRNEKQNEVIISLFGRIAFTPEVIRDLVVKNKKKEPEKYIGGYNACDGNHSVTDLANIIGVKQPT